MIALAVTFTVKPGNEAMALELLKKLATASRAEPGCRMYVLHTDPENARRIFLYEQYQDGYALAAHRSSTHYKIYAEEALPGLLENRELIIYHPVV
jgi:quinol monooxygenase YgiN